MDSAAMKNQFEMKDTCLKFAINASRQGNNVKIKFNLKYTCRDYRPNFLWNKWQRPSILFRFIKTYSWPCETNNMKCFVKTVNS